MSMISEKVKEFRTIANNLTIGHNMPISLAIKRFREAADTIESLSAKLREENCGDGWIPCKDRLPEEKKNPVTKDFCEYQVTFKSEDVTDIRHYKFGRGHWWNFGQIMDDYVTAWRPYITPYQEIHNEP